jgi:hypothetical protein
MPRLGTGPGALATHVGVLKIRAGVESISGGTWCKLSAPPFSNKAMGSSVSFAEESITALVHQIHTGVS